MEFMSSGKAGAMDEKDFNALFAALDTDGNGEVDFLEFCTYLSVCGQDIKIAREELQTLPQDRNELIRQMSKTLSRRFSVTGAAAQAIQEGEEEEGTA